MEVVLVLKDGVEVRVHANSVGEHLLLVVKEGVGAKILGKIHSLIHHRSTAITGGASAVYDAVWEAPHECMYVCMLEALQKRKRKTTSERK